MKKTIVLLMVLALAAPASLLAQGYQGKGDCDGTFRGPGPGHGQGMNCGHGMRGGMGERGGMGGGLALMRFADDLELTDTQIETLEKLRLDFQNANIDRKAEMQKAALKLRTLKKGDASESEVLSQIDVVTRLKGNMAKEMYRHHEAMKSVLTPEQTEKLDTLRKERGKDGSGKGMRNDGGRRGGGGRGGF
ncbi:MAG: Spy/CpxP family protein refolding chaperone [candidate division Zixibacteria bacterium]|nr:Spy/CpxP family protein refolding chaperone [candidate division Zixibacteria bacterium]